VAGAVSTGTHGSGWALGDLASMVIAVELLTLDENQQPVLYRFVRPGAQVQAERYTGPDVRIEDRDDPDEFRAVVISMGCMGIVYGLTLQVQDRFFLREDRVQRTWSQLKAEFPEAARVARHYEVLVSPYIVDQPVLVTTRVVVDGASLAVRSVGLELAATALGTRGAQARLSSFLEDPTTVPSGVQTGIGCSTTHNYARKSFRVLKIGLKVDANGLEMAIPVSKALSAAEAVIALVRARLAAWSDDGDAAVFWKDSAILTSPFSMRLVARSDALLSMQRPPDGETVAGEPYVMMEFPMLTHPDREADSGDLAYAAYRDGITGLYEQIEALLRDDFDGRPHWGLWFGSGPDEVAHGYGQAWATWREVYARFNAHGVFESAFTRRMGLHGQ